jgi:hypothetical protein
MPEIVHGQAGLAMFGTLMMSVVDAKGLRILGKISCKIIAFHRDVALRTQ